MTDTEMHLPGEGLGRAREHPGEPIPFPLSWSRSLALSQGVLRVRLRRQLPALP